MVLITHILKRADEKMKDLGILYKDRLAYFIKYLASEKIFEWYETKKEILTRWNFFKRELIFEFGNKNEILRMYYGSKQQLHEDLDAFVTRKIALAKRIDRQIEDLIFWKLLVNIIYSCKDDASFYLKEKLRNKPVDVSFTKFLKGCSYLYGK